MKIIVKKPYIIFEFDNRELYLEIDSKIIDEFANAFLNICDADNLILAKGDLKLIRILK